MRGCVRRCRLDSLTRAKSIAMQGNIFIPRRWWIGVRENLRVAWGSIASNKVRSVLTMIIVAVGITALMSMLTVLNALRSSISSLLSMQLGAPVIITHYAPTVVVNGERSKLGVDYREFTSWECRDFAQRIAPVGKASFSTFATSAQLVHEGKKTRPSITVYGVAQGYIDVLSKTLALGRDFTLSELQQGSFVVVLGWEHYRTLFGGVGDPAGKRVMVGSVPYTVVGVLAEQTSSFGVSGNEDVYIPYRNALATFTRGEPFFSIQARPNRPEELDQFVVQCERAMRRVRKLRPAQPSSFNITRSDQILGIVMGSLASVSAASMTIGLITLFGSAVGLMNIMLASVKSRTQEIGVRKAIGAKAGAIRRQFLIESITITFIGGLAGMLLGTIIGSVLAMFMQLEFVLPILWALFSLALAVAVGIIAGYVPAKRAADLDPIEALRYE